MREIKLNFQPLTLLIPEEREDMYASVKKAFDKANRMLADPKLPLEAKLDVMRVIAVLARALPQRSSLFYGYNDWGFRDPLRRFSGLRPRLSASRSPP